jgi:coenzyme PQQ precursor peptide PqqA
MKSSWTKPDFAEISVAGECTAYAGVLPPGPASAAGEQRTQELPAQPVAPVARREEQRDR